MNQEDRKLMDYVKGVYRDCSETATSQVRNLLEEYPQLLKVVRERDCSFSEAIQYLKKEREENGKGIETADRG